METIKITVHTGVLITAGLVSGIVCALVQHGRAQDIGSKPGPAILPSSRLDGVEVIGIRRARHVPSLTDAEARWIASQQNLQRLDLSESQVSWSHFELFADLRGMQTLSLRNTNTTDKCLARLERLEWLEELDLAQTRIGDEGLATIAGMSRLKRLSLGGGSKGITHKGLRHLQSLKALEELELSITGTDDELRLISRLPALKRLTLELKQPTDAGMAQLTSLNELVHLRVDRSTLHKRVKFSPKLAFPELESLELFDAPVDDAWTTQLATCPRLRRLVIRYPSEITDVGVGNISALASLRELQLSGVPKLTDSGVAALSKLKKLQVLHLCTCPAIGAEGVARIGSLTQLRNLSFAEVRIGNAGIAKLTELNALEELSINDETLTDACVQSLAKLKSLRTLWLFNTRISAKGFEELERSLVGCSVRSRFNTFGFAYYSDSSNDDEGSLIAKTGRAAGVVTAKGMPRIVEGAVFAEGDAWIEVRLDDQKQTHRFVPYWTGGAPSMGGGWDLKMAQSMKDVMPGSRVVLEWKYDQRPRVLKLEVLKNNR